MSLTFPDPTTWIPDQGARFSLIGQAVLDVAVGALALYPQTYSTATVDPTQTRADAYKQVYVAHGQTPPFTPGLKGREMNLCLQRIYVGRAGEQQYQFPKGKSAILAAVVGQYNLQMGAPYVSAKGGLTPSPPRIDQQETAASDFWTDALIVWSALITLVNGGVPRLWPNALNRADEIIVGPMEAYDPHGSVAGWHCQVNVAIGG